MSRPLYGLHSRDRGMSFEVEPLTSTGAIGIGSVVRFPTGALLHLVVEVGADRGGHDGPPLSLLSIRGPQWQRGCRSNDVRRALLEEIPLHILRRTHGLTPAAQKAVNAKSCFNVLAVLPNLGELMASGYKYSYNDQDGTIGRVIGTLSFEMGDIVRSVRRKSPGLCVYRILPGRGRVEALTYPDGIIDSRGREYTRPLDIEHVPIGELPESLRYLLEEKEENVQSPVQKAAPPPKPLQDAIEARFEKMTKLALRKACITNKTSRSRTAKMTKAEMIAHLRSVGYVPPRALDLRKKSVGRAKLEERLVELGWPDQALGVLTVSDMREVISGQTAYLAGDAPLVKAAFRETEMAKAGLKDAERELTQLREALIQKDRDIVLVGRDRDALKRQADLLSAADSGLRQAKADMEGQVQRLMVSLSKVISDTPENREAWEIGMEAIKRRKEIAKMDEDLDRFAAVGVLAEGR